MKLIFLIFLLTLAASTAAIDAAIYLKTSYCSGKYIICFNLGPDQCCSVSEAGLSTRFSALPHDWNIQTRSYRFADCANTQVAYVNMYGRDTSAICVDGTYRYQSVGYGFINGKKARDGVGKQCQKPNALGLSDGTQYNLTAMDEGQVNELVGLADVERAEDVPEKFKKYQM